MRNIISICVLVIGSSMLAGCPSSLTGDTYSRGEARTAQQVQLGVIESIRPIKIEGTKTGVGATAGALLGGLAGSNIGGGRGRYAGAVVGGVAGGVGGSAAEEALTRSDGLEITVRMESGKLMAVVQQASANESFNVGDRVRLVGHGSTMRVSH